MFWKRIAKIEMKPDCYSGEDCAQLKPQWDGHFEGDRDGDVSSEIIMKAEHFPPGTIIHVSVPECPRCTLNADHATDLKCPCGFNWEDWALDKYS